MIEGKRDGATVTPEGKRISKLIDGVVVRYATTHADERGELCEIYDPAWGITPEAMVYCYLTVVRAGKVKGQTPKVEAQEDKKRLPRGRAKKRLQYNRRYVNVVTGMGGKRVGPNSNADKMK